MTLTLPAYEKSKILVVGDVMLDRYWHGTASRISPEAPVPIVKINTLQELPGAAANVALNIAALGAHADLLSLTGDDEYSIKLESLLEKITGKTYFCKILHKPTIAKLRVISQHQQLIRLDFEEFFSEDDALKILEKYQVLINNQKNKYNMIILSDYGKGSLKYSLDLINLAHQKKIPVLVDPKGNDYKIYQNATCLTPNRKEFEAVVGKCQTDQDITEKALNLIQQLNLKALLVTRGAEGMSLIELGKMPLHLPAKKQEIFDVTGAGDTVISILGASLAAGKSLEQSVVLANIGAGIVVKKLGAGTVSSHELRRGLSEEHNRKKGIVSDTQLLEFIHDAHAYGEIIIMTNGCFDILHPGHIAYLEEAKKLGDHLIVAVNSDDSVKRLKGENRPVNNLDHRMQVLAGLASVDWVISFSEDTPEKLIGKLLPDILVKGGDYQVSQIAGADEILKNGGKVKILSFVEGHSTTKLIERVKNSAVK